MAAVKFSLDEILKIQKKYDLKPTWIIWSQMDTYVFVRKAQMYIIESLGKTQFFGSIGPEESLFLMLPAIKLDSFIKHTDCFTLDPKKQIPHFETFKKCIDDIDCQEVKVRRIAHPCKTKAECNQYQNMILVKEDTNSTTSSMLPTLAVSGLDGLDGAEVQTVYYASEKLHPFT